jgi:hypothetical protein
MKVFCKILLAAVLFICSMPVFAQKETKKWSIGIIPEYGFPLKDAKTFYHYDAGMTIRFSYHVGPGFVTASAGGIGFIPPLSLSDTASSSYSKLKAGVQIPFKAGYKLIFVHHIFIMGEAGYSDFYNYYLDANSNVQHTTTGGFTYAATAGFRLVRWKLVVNTRIFNCPEIQFQTSASASDSISDKANDMY